MNAQERIALADAPDIAGLAFRTFRGPVDFPGMVAVRERAGRRDRVDPLSPRETMLTLDDMPGLYGAVDPGSPNLLIAEVDGAMIGYNQMQWWTEEDGTALYLHLGWLAPEWRGRGIGTAMLRHAERRLQGVAAEHGTRATAMFGTNASSTEDDTTALVRAEGYRPVHALSDMILCPMPPLPRPPLPTGIALRPVRPAHYPAIYQGWKESWTGLFLTVAESVEEYAAFVADNAQAPGCDPALWTVAWDGDAVVGLVIGHIRRGVGLVPEVAVRPAWRRRGIARALLVEGLRALQRRGMSEARIVTDAANGQGARRLYESLGFREAKQHILYRKPMP